MPVWSIVIALAVLFSFALKLAILGGDDHRRAHPPETFPFVLQAARWLGIAVIALCAVNLLSALVQCGFGECHTEGYRLLGYEPPPASEAAPPAPAPEAAPAPAAPPAAPANP
jgi:hypothetical protein